MATSPIVLEAAAGHIDMCRLTVEQYDFLIESGQLPHDASTELLDGYIVKKDRSAVGEDRMTVGDRHRMAVLRLMALAPKFTQFGCYLQVQQPIVLLPNYEPEPDASVVRGSIDDASSGKPQAGDVCSVVEVADNSLRQDLGQKRRAYAAAGIAQYVVVDLVNDCVLDHRRPAGDRFDESATRRRGEFVHLLAGTGGAVEVNVASLLP